MVFRASSSKKRRMHREKEHLVLQARGHPLVYPAQRVATNRKRRRKHNASHLLQSPSELLSPASSIHSLSGEVASSLSLILALHNGVIVPTSKDHCEHLNSLKLRSWV